jgi:hypothetical protein
MEDLKFASATSEGEYRAKAAKIKLPMNDRKKFSNNKFNKNENKPQDEIKEQIEVQEAKIEQAENPSLSAVEAVKEVKEEKAKKTRGRGRKKAQEPEIKKDENIAQTVINSDSEIEPVISEKASKDIKTETNETAVTTASNEQDKTEEPKTAQKRSRRPNRNSGKKTKRVIKKDVEE